MTMTNLPPLPRAGIKAIGVDEKPLTVYRADQMRDYGALCRKQALEEAANLLEKAVQNINALSKSIANETAASALSYQATKIKGLMK